MTALRKDFSNQKMKRNKRKSLSNSKANARNKERMLAGLKNENARMFKRIKRIKRNK